MSKEFLTRFPPKTVKEYNIQMPTHCQKEETDIYPIRMVFNMLHTISYTYESE